MKIVMLYRRNTEGEGRAEDYAVEFGHRHPERQMQLLDVDSIEGDDKARVYGVVNYPAIIVVSDDGQLQQLWQDDQLPLMSEVEAYARV